MTVISRPPLERFHESYSETPNGCWEWQRARMKASRYGWFKTAGRMVAAHRFAYAELVGPIPDGMHVCHKCDNRGCVNPDHLFKLAEVLGVCQATVSHVRTGRNWGK